MIRNVVLGRLPADTDDATQHRVDVSLAGIAALNLPGQRSMSVGRDIGLRDGGWSFAITNDWSDEQSYRAYDTDPEHNEYRAVLVEACDQIARVQFVTPD